MPNHARHLLIAAALASGLVGCGKEAEKEPVRVAEGYYQCLFRDFHPTPSLDFVIGPGDSFNSFNTNEGVFRPGTYTFADGVITFHGSSLDGMRMRAEPDTDDHSGPFRLMDGKNAKPFLCTWKADEAPSLESLRQAATTGQKHPPANPVAS